MLRQILEYATVCIPVALYNPFTLTLRRFSFIFKIENTGCAWFAAGFI